MAIKEMEFNKKELLLILLVACFAVVVALLPVVQSATWAGNFSTDLISYWKLDEASGTTGIDEIAYKNLTGENGVVVNAAGKINKSYLFDGDNDRAIATSYDKLLGSYEVTLAGWFNVTDTNEDNFWAHTSSGAGNLNFQTYFQGGAIKLGAINGAGGNPICVKGGGEILTDTTGVLQNTWVHLVVVVNTTGYYAYLNGTFEGYEACDATGYWRNDGANQISMGQWIGSMKGHMDEQAIWNRSLSPAEISLLYNSGQGCTYGNESCFPLPPPPVITLPVYTNTTIKQNTALLTLNVSTDGVWCKINVGGNSNQSILASSGWCNSTAIALTGLADGKQFINAYANSSSGAWGLNNSYVVYVYSDPVVVVGISPVNNSNYTTSLVQFDYKCTVSPTGYLGFFSTTWRSEGGSTNINNESSGGGGGLINNTWANQTATLSDGHWRWTSVYCIDELSMISTLDIYRYFIVDTTPPVITLPVYANASIFQNTKSLTFNISAIDATMDAKFCKINVGGAANQTVVVSSGWCNGTYALTGLSDGNLTINAYANDTVGNWALNNSYVVFLDTTPPVITLPVYTNLTIKKNTDLLTLNISVNDSDGLCYQETANASTLSDGNCYQNYSGSYKIGTVQPGEPNYHYYDGDWTTYVLPIDSYQVNYSKSNQSGAIISYRFGEGVNTYFINESIPTVCFNQNQVSLLFTWNLGVFGNNQVNISCWNGLSYQLFEQNVVVNNIYFFEEAIWWAFGGTTPQSPVWVDITGTNQTVAYASGWANTTTLSLVGLTDAQYQIKVYDNDTAGNMALNDSFWVWIDNTNPIPYQGINPVDYYNDTDGSIVFDMRCTDTVSTSAIQLWTNTTGTWHANYTNASYLNNTWVNVTVTGIKSRNNYKWAVWCNDTAGNSDYTSNRTFNYPTVNTTLVSPANSANVAIANQSFNCSANATNTLSNITFYLWNASSLVNYSTVSLTGTYNYNVFNFTLPREDTYTWNCLAMDIYSLNDSADANFTIDYVPNITIWGMGNNSFVLEYSKQTFNITIERSDNLTTVTPSFWYNGTTYSSGITNTTVNTNITFIKTIDVPAVAEFLNENKSFYWNITISYGGNSHLQNSSVMSQNVSKMRINNSLEPGHINTINFTCFDDDSGLQINCTTNIKWNLWDPTNYGDFTKDEYSTTANASNTTFKNFYKHPAGLDFWSNIEVTASGLGYPQRIFTYVNQTLSDTSVNKNLYLTSSAVGLYVSFMTINIGNQVISGVYVKIEREIGGVVTLVAGDYTDDAGIVTFWLNPNYEHTITVSKTGFTTQVLTITPTQTLYTITMGQSSAYFNYSSNLEGISWTKWPPSGPMVCLAHDALYNFTLWVESRLSNGTANPNIVNCSMNITLGNFTQVAFMQGCNSSSGGVAYSAFNTSITKDRLIGEYLLWINMTNGTLRLITLERDARWMCIPGVSQGNVFDSLKGALQDFGNLSEWGTCEALSTETDCINSGCDWSSTLSTCSGTLRTTDFSKIVFFFILMAILLAVLNIFSGYDTAYPGSFLYIVTGIVVIMSLSNGLAGPGFFYLVDATPHLPGAIFATFASVVNNWILAAHFILLSIIYWFTTNKRYSTG